MRAPAAMALFTSKGKRRGRARFVAAALQKASVCTPKLGYRNYCTPWIHCGVKARARFQRYGAASTVGGFRAGSHACAHPTRAPCVFPSKKKTRFKPLVRKWYRLVFALPFPLCRLSYGNPLGWLVRIWGSLIFSHRRDRCATEPWSQRPPFAPSRPPPPHPGAHAGVYVCTMRVTLSQQPQTLTLHPEPYAVHPEPRSSILKSL